MIGKEDALKILDKVVSYAKGFDLGANLVSEDLSFTRYARNQIHQNLKRQNHVLTVKAIKGKKMGTASVNLLDEGSLRWVVQQAYESMELSQDDPELPLFSRADPAPEVNTYIPSTAAMKPKDRALGCGVVISAAQDKNLMASGTYSTIARENVVASTAGTRAYNVSTEAFFRTIVESGANTGYADRLVRNARDINYEEVAKEAMERASLFQEPVDLAPGRYDTIFLEYALSDLIRFLGYVAFGAASKQRGTSFMATKIGQTVMGDNVTIWDDGLDTRGFASPFDIEGTPREKVVFIDKGVAKGVVYDTKTAVKDGVRSTGHADVSWGRSQPRPHNMFMAPGDSSTEEMIKSTKEGILVTRFHYTHCPEPMRVVATGTTRDGTFLIKDGQIVARVRNLRFTESMLDAFSRIEAISRDSRVVRDWWSTFTSVLPSVKIKDFTFTGATTF
ncbi:MAG: TldD/PmbA family protein [Bacillota bacterium]